MSGVALGGTAGRSGLDQRTGRLPFRGRPGPIGDHASLRAEPHPCCEDRRHGSKVAVAITFDMDADSLVHVAPPRESITRVSIISMLAQWRFGWSGSEPSR